jgi:hypothetical protein
METTPNTRSKQCPTCKETKPWEEFYPNPKLRNGVGTYCKACARARALETYHRLKPPLKPKRVVTSLWTHKTCCFCKEEKPVSEFYKGGVYKGAQTYGTYCKPCHGVTHSVTIAKRARLFTLYKGGRTDEPTECDACGAPPVSPRNGKHRSGKTQGLAFDHDHETGEFRGWLCGGCNRALGLLEDDIEMILCLAMYLERHNNKGKSKANHPSNLALFS